MLIESIPLILLGFSLGLLHALDADHVMAISAMANQKPSMRRTLLFSMNWALGHGGVLLICGVILFGVGLTIPENLQHLAELSVGILMITLGLSFYWRMHTLKVKLTQHKHDGVVHTHWTTDDHQVDTKVKKSLDKHQPVMIGMLHGLAGSAPALALIPAVASGQLALAITYLLIFSFGVMLSMLVFGLGFSWMQNYLFLHYQRISVVCRHVVALAAIVFGGFWVIQNTIA